jgi:hypothetical protein
VSNLLCIAEPADALTGELPGIADRLTVILPWGSLLRVVASPESASLESLRRLCASNAKVEIVFSYDRKRDAGEGGPLGCGGIEERHVQGVLRESYERAGFRIVSIESISREELVSYQTTWAGRLAFGAPREVWRVRGLAADCTNDRNP